MNIDFELQVKGASATEVPAGIPVAFSAKLHLPKGLFNLSMALVPLTKGMRSTQLRLLHIPFGPNRLEFNRD